MNENVIAIVHRLQRAINKKNENVTLTIESYVKLISSCYLINSSLIITILWNSITKKGQLDQIKIAKVKINTSNNKAKRIDWIA